MLKKTARLSRLAILELAQKGRKVRGPLFDIAYRRAMEGKAAISVSKKTANTAVLRHRIRRRLYSLIMERGLPKADILIIVKAPAVTADRERLGRELGTLLSRAGSS